MVKKVRTHRQGATLDWDGSPGSSSHSAEMNECLKLGSVEGRANDLKWVQSEVDSGLAIFRVAAAYQR